MNVRHSLAALAALALLAAPAAAQTPSADELVAKNLAARGGEARLKELSTIRISGTIVIQGMEMPITMTTKRPNKMKQEMTMQGQRLVQAFDGTTVWAVNPMLGGNAPRVVEGSQADALKAQALFDGPLVGYKDRGDTLEVVGQADVEGTKTWKLKLARKDGMTMHIFLDAETGLERQWSATMEQNGLMMEIDTIMADYQATGGVQIARSMRTLVGGQSMGALTITNVEFDVPVDDAEFAMPK